MQAHRMTATPLDIDALVDELGLDVAFPPEALAEAERAATKPLPDYPDARDIPLVTIDPPGSLDLDQAVAIDTRAGGGWIVHYAIADVGAFVEPGGALDTATRQRGETLYAPDRRIPLHPDVLGQGAMSLLAGQERPAVLWRIEVDSDGSTRDVDVRRAIVRSRAKLDYPSVQHAFDAGTLPESIAALPAFGRTRHAWAIANGAIELNLPEQDVEAHDGAWTLTYRTPLDVEIWNSQVSLLTGAAAARIMLDGHIGLLRTLPAASAQTVERLRRAAPGLGVNWADGVLAGEVIAGLDLADPRHVAFVDLASELLRGAAYTPFDGDLPAEPGHGGVGGIYAHATAPIRRLGDRFVNEICLALAGGVDVPEWARQALPELPEVLADSGRRSRTFDRAIVDGTEAHLLAGRVGERFEAIIVDVEPGRRASISKANGGANGHDAAASNGSEGADDGTSTASAMASERGTVMLETPAVTARVDGVDLPLGRRTEVRLTQADMTTRTVRFTYPA